MATFNAKSFEKKLKSLDGSQTGIQTLSLWIIHHRQHASLITSTWLGQLGKTQRVERRLGLFYLANDVVQNGRRKAKDLVIAFGRAFIEATPFLCDEKIIGQVGRVFDIWSERNVYDKQLIKALREKLEITQTGSQQSKPTQQTNNKHSKPKTKPKEKPKEKPKAKPVEKEAPEKAAPAVQKIVPPNFKVSSLLVTMKKTTSLDRDIERKSTAIENLKIDASSYDSVKHIKDRSSVGKFFKQFEESKVILEDYLNTLRKSQRDKEALLKLLSGGEIFYELAQDEAKVIVNAYKTFGNRLNSMKKKLEGKIKKIEQDALGSTTVLQERSRKNSINSQENHSHIEDMELDSDSGDDIPASQQYNPTTAPSHDLSDDASTTPNQSLSESSYTMQHSTSISDTSFFNPQAMNGMSSFMNLSASGEDVFSMQPQQQQQQQQQQQKITTPVSDPSPTTPDGLIIAEDHHFTVHSSKDSTSTTCGNTDQAATNEQRPLKNLIDSLFPVLSRSLQTIKEKQQAADDERKPSISDAIAFALGDGNRTEEVPKKKSRFSNIGPSNAISPISLTNPTGLSNNQTELISIAAGLTKFDENFLPVSEHHTQDHMLQGNDITQQETNPQQDEIDEKNISNEDYNRKRDERKGRHSSSRRRSHKDDDRHKRSNSSSRSPSRRHSHRSSRDSRDDKHDERHHDRRRSKRSPSPRRKRSSRSRRSTSREKDDEKRRHSPDQRKTPYYNDRRSPTPELDSSSQPSVQAQYPLAVVQQAGMSNQTFSAQPGETQNNGIALEHSHVDSSNLSKAESTATASSITTAVEQSNVNGILPISDPLQLPMQLAMNSALNPLIGSFANPLQLLQQQQQQQQGTNATKVLHLRPIGPGMVPFGQPMQNLLNQPPINLLGNTPNLLQNFNQNQTNDQAPQMNSNHNQPWMTNLNPPVGFPPGPVPSMSSTNGNESTSVSNAFIESKPNNPLQMLSKQPVTEGERNAVGQGLFTPSNSNFSGPPEFPGPPPMPPPSFLQTNFQGMPRFSGDRMFQPRFAEPDPLLDQLEARGQSTESEGDYKPEGNFEVPSFQPTNFQAVDFEHLPRGPRFRPRFVVQPGGVRFRPRFEQRPRFHPPMH